MLFEQIDETWSIYPWLLTKGSAYKTWDLRLGLPKSKPDTSVMEISGIRARSSRSICDLPLVITILPVPPIHLSEGVVRYVVVPGDSA